MTRNSNAALLACLCGLVDETDGLVSDLARVFAAVLEESAPETGCLAVRAIIEQISAATEQAISESQSPTKVVEALLRIDTRILEKKAADAPFAMRLAPLAMERALHAEKVRWSDEREQNLAARSPIFRTAERTVFAVPVGLVTDEALGAFSDRVLAEVLKGKPRLVNLVLGGLEPGIARHTTWDILESDLKSQKVRLKRIMD